MDNESLKAALIEICRKYILRQDTNTVLCEPYIPYIPDNWFGDLMLAEAQNLSTSNQEYVDRLRAASEKERITRLKSSEDLGIGPWDDDTMKLAYEAAFGQCAENVAVSNGVLWSEISENGSNKSPSAELIALSTELWQELLLLLNPKRIITCGKNARMVIEGITGSRTVVKLRLPSPRALCQVSSMFDKADLLSRYHEVSDLKAKRPEWFKNVSRGNNEQNKVFYACHAVSVYSGVKKQQS